MTAPSQLKILQIIHFYHTGGLEQLALRLGQAIKERGHQSHVLALEPGPMRKRFHEAGITTHCAMRPSGFSPRFLFQLSTFLARHRFDIVHTHHISPMLYGAPAGRLSGASIVHTTHSNEHLHPPEHSTDPAAASRSYRSMFQWLSKSCDHIATVNENLRDFLVQDMHVGTQVSAIPNGVDANVFSGQHNTKELLQELGIPKDEPWLGVVGRLAPEKGHNVLLEALPKLKAPFHLLIVGDGQLRDELQSKVNELKLNERVHFLGLRNDLPVLFSAMDLLVLPSLREGLPLVILEAMASGVPVLGSDVGSVAKVLQSSNAGVVVPPGDSEALATHLEHLLNHQGSLQEMSYSGQTWVKQNYNQTRMVDQYEAIYLKEVQDRHMVRRAASRIQASSLSLLHNLPFVGGPAMQSLEL